MQEYQWKMHPAVNCLCKETIEASIDAVEDLEVAETCSCRASAATFVDHELQNKRDDVGA